jgi:hypothetical protein
MDERTEWERRARPSEPREPFEPQERFEPREPRESWEPPSGFEDWSAGNARDRAGTGPRPGPGGGPRIPDISAVLAIVEALRRAVPHELQEQFTALQRELLLTLRTLIDWYLDRLDKPELEPKIEDIPIE